MISEVFEMEKASACGCRQKEPRVSPLTEGSERLFFLLWHKSPYMWYTDREQKYKNMLSITDELLFHRRESEALW